MRGLPFTLQGKRYVIVFQYPGKTSEDADFAGTTFCYIYEDTGKKWKKGDKEAKPVTVGAAICSPEDTFFKSIGRIVSLKKALAAWDLTQDSFQEVKDSNGKWWPMIDPSTGRKIVAVSRRAERISIFEQYEEALHPTQQEETQKEANG